MAALTQGIAALEPTTPLAEYGRQSWAMENGLPQNSVHALVQTNDGFLWLGTEAGLVRFDGVSFLVLDQNSRPALPSGDIRCLLAAKDGALWIGTDEGLVRWKNGAATTWTTKEGLPANEIEQIAETTDGLIWVRTSDGLARLVGDQFAQQTPDKPGISIDSIIAGANGSLWVGTSAGAREIRKGKWLNLCAACPDLAAHIGAGPGGGILAASQGVLIDPITSLGMIFAFAPDLPKGRVEFMAGPSEQVEVVASRDEVVVKPVGRGVMARLKVGKELPGSRVQALYADREGGVWIGTNRGLARWASGKLQRFPVTDPLASASILSVLEDHEGDLWVGTEAGGLNILRDTRFRNVGAHEGLSSDATTTVVQDAAETIWAGTDGGGLNVVRRKVNVPGAATTYPLRDVLLSDVILSLAASKTGELWVGTPDGLNRIRGGAVDGFTASDGLPDDFIRSLLVDGDGSLWIGTRRGLAHWTFTSGAEGARRTIARKETYTRANGLGSDLVGAMARDTRGNLWVATLAGLSRLKGGKFTNFTTANGLSSNVVTALLPRAAGTLLVGTQDRGWNLWDGEKFSAVTAAGLSQTSVYSILDDASNHLWLATGTGIARCDTTATVECTHWIEFGPSDGLRSREMATNGHPAAWRTGDGHLWFATPKGLVEVDPAHFPVNTTPPPVVMERFAVDDVDVPLREADPRLTVKAGQDHIQFDYAGLSFVAPQKVRYRFMLEGFDKGWTEAGSRRVAYYTNIPPGTYTFRVQAANNDGVWNTEGAALELELQPHFYQTLWFYVLLVLTAGGLVALFLRQRLMAAEGEFKAVLGERNRIAREIHDTLAQGYVGISVQLEVLAELLRQNKVDAAARQLDLTRGHVREGLAEARQSIWALRSQDASEKTLPVALRRETENAGGHGLEAHFDVHGAYRALPPGKEREILRVAQEAIHNVKKHAQAKHLSVQLDYGPAEVALEVRDDGRGFAVKEESTAEPGHYGLTGMRERAAAIGGTLEVTSAPGEGTTLRLRATTPREAH